MFVAIKITFYVLRVWLELFFISKQFGSNLFKCTQADLGSEGRSRMEMQTQVEEATSVTKNQGREMRTLE